MNKYFISRINRILISVFLIFMAINIFILVTISYNLSNQKFQEITESQLKQGYKSAEFYMLTIGKTSNFIKNNAKFLEALKEKSNEADYYEVIEGFLGVNNNVDGIILYTEKGESYSTYNVVKPARFEEFNKQYPLAELTREEPIIWVIRGNEEYFYNSNSVSGLLSQISLISDEDGKTLGYLIVDISLDKISRLFFNEEEKNNLNVNIMFGDKLGHTYFSSYNSKNFEPESTKYTESQMKLETFDINIRTFIPKINIDDIVWKSLFYAFLIAILCLGGYLVLLKYMEKSIIEPINHLKEKILLYINNKKE
ncbi:MAG: cache domain-containing protein [Oscillospiraceae bacterium]